MDARVRGVPLPVMACFTVACLSRQLAPGWLPDWAYDTVA